MKKGMLIVLLAVGVVASASAGDPLKKGKKSSHKAKADTCFSSMPDKYASVDKLMDDMHRQSRDFFDNAMSMLKDFDMNGIELPSGLDTVIVKQHGDAVDSIGHARKLKHRGMIINRPKMHGKNYSFNVDSLGKNESIVVLSDGKKTTIIKNGTDTTIVDGPMSSSMLGGRFDFDNEDGMMEMPRFNFRGFRNFDDGFDRSFDVQRDRLPRAEKIAPESPSVQEMEMLVKKGIVSGKDAKSKLNVKSVNVISNMRGSTYSVVFWLDGVEQCDLQVVTPDGVSLEKATIVGSDGKFRRTLKITPNQDYVYIVVSSDRKVFVSKFWF